VSSSSEHILAVTHARRGPILVFAEIDTDRLCEAVADACDEQEDVGHVALTRELVHPTEEDDQHTARQNVAAHNPTQSVGAILRTVQGLHTASHSGAVSTTSERVAEAAQRTAAQGSACTRTLNWSMKKVNRSRSGLMSTKKPSIVTKLPQLRVSGPRMAAAARVCSRSGTK
jgi:hypothetical protein